MCGEPHTYQANKGLELIPRLLYLAGKEMEVLERAEDLARTM